MSYCVWKCSICNEEFSTPDAAEEHELGHAHKLSGTKYMSDGKTVPCSVDITAKADKCELRFTWITNSERNQSAKYGMDMIELADAVNTLSLSVDKCLNESVIETVIIPETGTPLPDESTTDAAHLVHI